MYKMMIIPAAITLAIIVQQSFAESCEAHKFVKTEGMELANHVIETVTKSFVQLCWGQCAWLPRCISVNARKVLEIFYECDLNDSNTTTTALVPREGSDYYEMTKPEEKICKLYSCEKQNGKTSVPSTTTIPTTTSSTTTEVATTANPTTSTTTGAPTTQPITIPPSECELNFPRASTSDFVKISPALSKAITAFTVAFWVKVPSSYRGTVQVFSYKTADGQSELSVGIEDDNDLEIIINGDDKDPQSNFARDDTWQYIAITWRNSDGNVKFYRNGALFRSITGWQIGQTILSGGVFYLGQTHGGFDEAKVIQGSIADLQIYHNAVKDGTVTKMYGWKCATARYFNQGDILSWETIVKSPYNGQVSKVCPATCLN